MVAVQVDKTVIFGQYIGGDFYPSHAKKSRSFATFEAAKNAADKFNKKG